MAQQVTINVSALNHFLNRVVQPYLRDKADEIASEIRRTAPAGATNELRNSVEVRPGAKGSVSISVTAPYAGFVSEGTGPGASPPRAQYYPKLRRRGLILWSDSKGANPQAVAHGISLKGTPANPYFEDSIARILGGFNFKWIIKKPETK
jgi:hypothetical protein